MAGMSKRRSGKAGLPPGTLVHIGEKKRDKVSIDAIYYNQNKFEEQVIESLDQCPLNSSSGDICWLNVDGIHQVEILEKIGKWFGLHHLVTEDILNTEQRAKIEDYGDYIYIVLKMLYIDERTEKIIIEQTSIVLGNNFVLSFGEREGDVFNPIRERLKNGIGRLRKMGADYLVYSLLDAIVDNYFIVLERLGDKIELAEGKLFDRPSADSLKTIQYLRKEILFLHKAVWPLREVIGTLQRGEHELTCETTEVYLRDVYDHVIQIIDTVEIFRDMLSGMLDVYLSSTNNRMNEVMKVLTIISTLFMPLTFIAGIYGMNFKYMPEIEERWAYPAVLMLMFIIASVMVLYFKKKKWL